MKAAIVTRAGKIEVQQISLPVPDEYQTLVEVTACGFCNGTDIKIVEGHWPGVDPFPFILGHEAVGRVLSTGRKVRNLKPGDQVLNPGVGAYPALGIGSAYGGFVERAVATDWQAMIEDKLELANPFFRAQQVVPPHMDHLDAVMLITLKEVYSALQGFGLKPGMDVLVFGDGPVGICMVLCACQMGAGRVILCGHHDERLSLGEEMGATHAINSKRSDVQKMIKELAPQGIPLIVDAIGSNEVVQQALDMIADEGHIGIYGYSDQRSATFDWSRAPVRWSIDYLVVPQLDRLVACHEVLVEWIMNGRISAKKLVTHRLAMDEIQSAYQLVRERQALKAVVEIEAR